MKSFLALALVALSSPVFAQGRIDLPWTFDAASVQAILVQVIADEYQQQSPMLPSIVRDSQGHLVLKDQNTKLVCEENGGGMLATEQYHCTMTSRYGNARKIVLPWEMSSNSVQGVLKHGLTALFDKVQSGQVSFPMVKADRAGNLVVEDSQAKLTCSEGTAGMLATQQYTCTLTLK